MLNAERRSRLAERWRVLRARPETERTLTLLRRVMLVGVVGYLVFKLTHVGWVEVYENLPESPWFYVFFLLRYFALPLSEIPAYELVWRRPLWRHVTAFIRKRVYNFAVMGYSGEAFFTLWARRHLGLTDAAVLSGVKDNNILSAFASNIATAILVVVVAATQGLGSSLAALPGALVLFCLAFLSSVVMAAAVLLFGGRLIDAPRAETTALIAIHGGRMVLVLFFHAAMYAAALPAGAFTAWLLLISLQLVISRVPFVPNQDLVFLGAALALAEETGVPEAAIAGMLVAEAGLSQLLNFGFFFATAHDARIPKAVAGDNEAGDDPRL